MKKHFVLTLIAFCSLQAFGQDSAPPDSKLRNVDANGKPRDFNEVDWGFTTARMGMAFMNDWAWYIQDDNSKDQLDSANVDLGYDSKVRDIRMFFSGKIKCKRYIEWRAAIMYDGIEERFTMRETGIIVGLPELSGKIFVGRSKEGFSSSKVENGYACPAIERQPALDPIPIMTDGIRYFGASKKPNLFWSLGWNTNLIYGSGNRFMPYKWTLAARFGWLPLYKPEKNTWIHVGMSFRYSKPDGDKMQIKSKPESNPAPNYIDTKTSDCNQAIGYGPELYFYNGPLCVGSETFIYNYKSVQAGDPMFWGGNILITYNLTGESYPYIKDNAVSFFIDPKKSVFQKGPGAWQLLATATIYNTNNGLMPGGEWWKVTGMVNWYPSNDFAFKFVYGYGVLDRFDIKGGTHFFALRFQINIM